jgi:predicted acylesterase/phospholipase RssA
MMKETDELFLARQDIFVREAREACHKSLFFLGMLYESNWKRTTVAIRVYTEFAMHQVKGLIKGIHIPSAWKEKSGELGKVENAKTDSEKETIKKIKNAVYLCHQWQQLKDYLSDEDNHSLDKVPDFREDLHKFLKDSRPGKCWRWIIHIGFQNFLSYLRKKIAFLWAALLVIFAFFYVEAINGLLRNEGWGVVVPLLLVSLPTIANRIYIWWLFSRKQKIAFWDMCGHPLRSLRWLAVEPGRLVQRWSEGTPMARRILVTNAVRLGIYLLWWLVWLAILSNVGTSMKTVYAFMIIGFSILSAAYLLDLWDFTSRWPIRFLALVIAFVGLGLLLAGSEHMSFIIYFLIIAGGFLIQLIRKAKNKQNWYVDLIFMGGFIFLSVLTIKGLATHNSEIWRDTVTEAQIPGRVLKKEWPLPISPDEKQTTAPPVVVMIASGGGSRAAVFTGLTLQSLNADKELTEVAENLQAISSVSGGSLANAAYVARLLALSKDGNKKSDADSRKKALEDLVDVLAGDFLWPTLGGLFSWDLTRGSAIEIEWRENEVNLGDYRLGDLIKAWQAAQVSESPIPPFPIPLFNTASLEGHDVVISPLDKSFYVQNKLQAHAAIRQVGNTYASHNYYLEISNLDIEEITDPDDEAPTWVFYRDGIYGLEDFLMKYNPRLAEAVRASANFPFGFPLVKIVTQKNILFSPQITEMDMKKQEDSPKTKLIRLTDGGALSNSGMWSMYHLLWNNWKALKARGVLLIIVDAGKMPVYRDLQKAYNSLVGTIQDQSTIGQNLHRRMYDSLQLVYEDRLAIVNLGLIEKKYYNVMTTWALDNESLKRIKSSFNATWPDNKKDILSKWRALKEKRRPTGVKLIDRRRPPMD